MGFIALADHQTAKGEGTYRAATVAEALAHFQSAQCSATPIQAELSLRWASDEQAPGLFEAHYGLGTLLWKSGKAAEARVHLQKASQSGNSAQREEALRALASIR